MILIYKLTTIQKPTYLHFIITGKNTVENIGRYFEEINRECAARKVFRILVEERLDGPRLDVIKVLELISEQSCKYRGIFEAIAYADLNAEGNSMNFIENVAVNRGLPMSVFSTVADAEKWLVNKITEVQNQMLYEV
jgi:hypothetical protein